VPPPDAVFAETSRFPEPDITTTPPLSAIAAVVGLPTRNAYAAFDVVALALPFATSAINSVTLAVSVRNLRTAHLYTFGPRKPAILRHRETLIRPEAIVSGTKTTPGWTAPPPGHASATGTATERP
jgi:hypothetical protein